MISGNLLRGWMRQISSGLRLRKDESGRFHLPSIVIDSTSGDLYSFRRQSLMVMGLYYPMSAPIIIDPVAVNNPIPSATFIHENMHQMLTDRTNFGAFHTILEVGAKQDVILRDALAMSMRAQWSVQEMDATYSEIAFVADQYPDYLPEAIASLPSATRGGPPYREAYDSVARHLPVSRLDPKEDLRDKSLLVHLIATWSMSNDCLTRFRDPADFTVLTFRHFLKTQSPQIRFERLFSQLLRRELLPDLLSKVAQAVRSPDQDKAALPIFAEFSSMDNEPQKDYLLSTLEDQLEALIAAWKLESLDVTTDKVVGRNKKPPMLLPNMIDMPQQVANFRSRCTLTTTTLAQEFSQAEALGKGVVFALSTNGQASRLYFGTYTVDETGLYPSTSASPDPTHRNLWGELPFDEICRVLNGIESLPQIFIFRGIAAWHFWRQQDHRHEAGSHRICVCTTSHGIEMDQIQRMLEFCGIRDGAEYQFCQISNSETRGIFIKSRNAPDRYLLIRFQAEIGFIFFEQVAQQLGLEAATSVNDPRQEALKWFLFNVESL